VASNASRQRLHARSVLSLRLDEVGYLQPLGTLAGQGQGALLDALPVLQAGEPVNGNHLFEEYA